MAGMLARISGALIRDPTAVDTVVTILVEVRFIMHNSLVLNRILGRHVFYVPNAQSKTNVARR